MINGKSFFAILCLLTISVFTSAAFSGPRSNNKERFAVSVNRDTRVVPMRIECRQEIVSVSKSVVYDVKQRDNIVDGHAAFILDSIFW